MRAPRLLLLAGLAGLLAAAGTALGAAPPEAGWSPASFPADVQDLSLAADSDMAVVGLEDPGQDGDPLHFLTLDAGAVSSHDNTFLTSTAGVDAVAASDDGTGFVAGVDRTDGPNVYFFDRSGAENGTESWSEELQRGVTSVAITPDGDRVAVGTSDGSTGAVYLLDTTGEGTFLIEHDADGPVHDVALGAQGDWVVAGGEVVENGTTQANVLLFRETSGQTPVDTYSDEATLPAVVRTVAVTPDGSLVLAGTAGGNLASFANDGGTLSEPDVNALGGTQVADASVDPDGTRVAAGATNGVHLLDRVGDGPDLEVRWSADTPAAVSSLATSRDLAYAVAAVPGSAGGVFAYHADRPEPIWNLSADAELAAAAGDASHVLAARDGNVTGYALHRAVEAGFPVGGTLADEPGTVPRTEPGTAVTVSVGVRNLGSLADAYDVFARTTGDWDLSLDRHQVDALPEETAVVNLTAEPGDVEAGRHEIHVEVVSAADDEVTANVTVLVDVEGETAITLTRQGPNASRPVEPGDRTRAFFTVQNLGNERANVSVFTRLTPTSQPSWSIAHAPNRVGPLGPGETTSFTVRVDVPEDAPDGDTRDLTVSVEAQGSSDSSTLRYVVNPFRDVRIEVDPPNRLVNATVPGYFNVTVENLGSVSTDFKILFSRQVSGTQGWAIEVQRRAFVVDAGDSRTLPMVIHAPKNGVIDDRVVVKVQAVPADLADQLDPDIQDNETVSAVFADLPDEDDEPVLDRIPGPGAGAALAAGLAGAAARARGCPPGDGGTGRTPRTSETYKKMQSGREEYPSAGHPCRWTPRQVKS